MPSVSPPTTGSSSRKAGDRFWRHRGKEDKTTRLVDDACIFLNRPDFHAGAGCALHLGALQAGERPLDWKPTVCWQLPLRLEEEDDGHGHRTATLREWKRRDWGDGGDQFAWWCTDSPLAFVGGDPVYKSLKAELVEMIGPEVYKILVAQLERPVPLPHPVFRQGRKRGRSLPPGSTSPNAGPGIARLDHSAHQRADRQDHQIGAEAADDQRHSLPRRDLGSADHVIEDHSEEGDQQDDRRPSDHCAFAPVGAEQVPECDRHPCRVQDEREEVRIQAEEHRRDRSHEYSKHGESFRLVDDEPGRKIGDHDRIEIHRMAEQRHRRPGPPVPRRRRAWSPAVPAWAPSPPGCSGRIPSPFSMTRPSCSVDPASSKSRGSLRPSHVAKACKPTGRVVDTSLP